MAELKPIEVVMRIDFAASNGIEVIAHAERVCELVRCKDCKHLSEHRIAPEWQRICRWLGVGKSDDGYCDEGERKETGDARGTE